MSNFFLTQKEAEDRVASVVGSPEYVLYLNLKKGEEFNGLISIAITLSSTSNLFLDFNGKAITFLRTNDSEWTKEQIAEHYKEGKIQLPADKLVKGENKLEICFECMYSHDGNGLHSYTDSDGLQYGYCQTEPYCCNRIFPVFDQPDMKASVTYLINAPSDWTVITNTPITKKAKTSEFQDDLPQLKLAKEHFKQDFTSENSELCLYHKTPHLSSYLFGIAFGPFKEIKSEDKDTVPMSIYCRASLFDFAKEQQSKIFVFPKEGIKFYESFFKTKYPFEKYDMVFCPEYTVGAMEYPGIITFNDRLIIRDVPTVEQYTLLGKVNLHELAHMWFGNLVTLKWWNDLWLNESFADFACYVCGHEIQKKLGFPISDSMTMFCIRKNWGYNEDQMVTTHPIACEVSNTSKAESIFDGITYSKGAATLKQLYFVLGHEAFSNNLADYFKKYSWKNATLKDFLTELAKASKTDHPIFNLEEWNKSWIETAGLNVIELEWEEGKKEITFHQSGAMEQHKTLRYHKMKIAFYDENVKPIKVQEIIIEPKDITVIQAEAENFKAILPNFDDWDFAKLCFDKKSSQFFTQNFSKLDGLNQMIVLRGFYEMVRDAKMKGTDFIDLVLNQVLTFQMGNLNFNTVLNYMNAAKSFIPRSFRNESGTKVFDKIYELLQTEKDNDKRKILTDNLITFAKTKGHVEILKSILDQKNEKVSQKLNAKEKWRIALKIIKSTHYPREQKNEIKNHLLQEDKTDTAKDAIITIEALTTFKPELESIWREYFSSQRKFSFMDISHSLAGFFDESKDKAIKHEYLVRFFNEYPEIANKEAKEICKNLFEVVNHFDDFDFLIPSLETLKTKIDPAKEFIHILIAKEIDGLKRRQKAYALYPKEKHDDDKHHQGHEGETSCKKQECDPHCHGKNKKKHSSEFVFSSEQVSEGHPDKMADIISDSVLDAILEQDPDGKVAIETLIKSNQIIVAGEYTSKAKLDLDQVIKARLEQIGYEDENYDFNPKTCKIIYLIEAQSPEIAKAVSQDKKEEDIGAGDQGLMIGYATNETKELMPLTFVYATRLLRALKDARINKTIPWLRPDAKSQVVVRYKRDDSGNLHPIDVDNVLISTQHKEGISQKEIVETITNEIVKKVIDPKHLTPKTRILINPSESFVYGGPKSDAGVTGRKIICDTYGGWAGHGGGAFSGKDPSKVDRSGAYAARWIAKSLVAAGLCNRCVVQVSYAIGISDPLSLLVDSYGTVKEGLTDDDLADIIKKNFDLKPGMIIKNLGLKVPIYSKNCTYGHFLHKDVPWEKVKELK